MLLHLEHRDEKERYGNKVYKVGDKVRVIRGLKEYESYGSTEDVVFGMLCYQGKIAEIKKVREDGVYKISCDNSWWWWPEKTLEPLKMTVADKIRGMTDEEMAKYLCSHLCRDVTVDFVLEWLRDEE